jgi:hypothetical protein
MSRIRKSLVRFRSGSVKNCFKIGIMLLIIWTILFCLFIISKNKYYTFKISLSSQKDSLKIDTTTDNNDEYFELQDGRTDDAFMLIEKFNLINPGENGSAVILPNNITDNIKRQIDEGFKYDGFNSFISSLISLNRALPDSRNYECKKKIYNIEKLPTCSIIIIFHNENWTLLLRTIHSILLRSPLELIEEILLVDDASDRGKVEVPI